METPDDHLPHQHCCHIADAEKKRNSPSSDKTPRLVPGNSIENMHSAGRSTSEKDVEVKSDIKSFEAGEEDDCEAWESTLPTSKSRRGRKRSVSLQEEKEDDVCFICFDGGDLVLCDMRHCPKVYHAACTGRESDYFLQKGKWYCGWHVCALCAKRTDTQCHTCPNSYCNNCVGKTNFISLEKGKGLCESCIPLISMIEQNLTVDSDGSEVNFEAGDTYECLFKDYWEGLKKKISITWADIEQARKSMDSRQPAHNVVKAAASDGNDGRSFGTEQLRHFTRKRTLKMRGSTLENTSDSEYEAHSEEDEEEHHDDEIKPKRGREKARHFVGWASEAIINFLQAIGENSEKPLSLTAAAKLLWSYIETNKLAHEHCNLVKCDEKLYTLFQKKYVRKFEITKLLSLHVASKKRMSAEEPSPDDVGVKGLDNNNDKLQKLWKSKKKLDNSEKLKSDPSYYAAIDVKNIGLIYLKRRLLEVLSEDPDFEKKVQGAFVRIRIPASNGKNDACYRLVQIIGIKKVQATENAVKGRNVVLEVLNLQKCEEITLDVVSSQDFTVDECLRLQQCVNSGLLKAMTVGQLEEKARDLREVKMKDWYENELLRLGNLRDRASEKGHKKELRECVEKIQILNSPGERERQLKAPIQVNIDPHMHSHHESNNPKLSPTNDKGLQSYWAKGFVQNVRRKSNTKEASQIGSFVDANQENISNYFQSREKISQPVGKKVGQSNDTVNTEANCNIEKNLIKMNGRRDENLGLNTKDKKLNCNSNQSDLENITCKKLNDLGSNANACHTGQSTAWKNCCSSLGKEDVHANNSRPIDSPKETDACTTPIPSTAEFEKINEKEKMWHYQDPNKKVHGPFSMEQLRKWEKTKLFPLDLQVWRNTESQEDGILLTDALQGIVYSKLPPGFGEQGGNRFQDQVEGVSKAPVGGSVDYHRYDHQSKLLTSKKDLSC